MKYRYNSTKGRYLLAEFDGQVQSLPTASAALEGTVYQYVGATDSNYTSGYFYRCESDGAATPTYSWVQRNVQPQTSGDYIEKVTTMPTASADELGNEYQYMGTDDSTNGLIHAHFYECVSDGESTPTYSWHDLGYKKVFQGTLDEWNALTEAEKAKYDFVASPDENGYEAPFTKYFVISNSDVNVGESFYTNATNSFEVFKIVADTIFNDLDTSGELTPYVGHATAYTTDSSGYPNMGVTTWVASACMGANGHPYIRIRIFTDEGCEYIFQRFQDGNYILAPNERYSTTETKTNKAWIDGKPIYRKVVDLGALPNTTTKTVNHGISNLDAIINWYGYAERPSDGCHFPLPYVFGGLAENNIGVFASPSVIIVTTGTDRSEMTGTIIIEYTKTTD